MLFCACAADLRQEFPFDGEAQTGVFFSVARADDEVRQATVNASNKSAFVFVDLDSDAQLSTDQAFGDNTWDLSFQRFKIAMNGGAQNPSGTVRAAVVENASFDTVALPPSSKFEEDGAETVFNGAAGGWYFYDISKHRLQTVTSRLYIVKSSNGKYFKIEMGSYYDAAGTPAIITFKYAPMP
jgi:hypothetical protein